MDLVLKSIILEDFKGKHELTVPVGKRTMVSGQNGSGKTTLYDAHLWLWADRDSSLRSNPDIRPDDGRECIVKVTEEWEIDGVPVEIAKIQKKKVTEAKDGGQPKVSLTNSYEINGVSKTERDFRKDLTDRGFNFDVFLPLSHIDVFTGQKASEMRFVLFAMTSARSDREIAEMTKGCEDVAELLGKYKMDEISAMYKASMKKSDEQCKAIPNQIIGLEKAKVDIDVAELELRRNSLKESISKAEQEVADISNGTGAYDALAKEIQELNGKRSEMEIAAQNEVLDKRLAARDKIAGLNTDKRDMASHLADMELSIEITNKAIQRDEVEIKKAREEYANLSEKEFDETELDAIKAEQFDEASLVCPTCGQMFPEERRLEIIRSAAESKQKRIREQESKKEEFYKYKDARLDEITETGNELNTRLKGNKDKVVDLENQIAVLKKEIASISEQIEQENASLASIPEKADLFKNKEYVELSEQIREKESQLQSMQNPAEYRREQVSKILSLRDELSAVNAEIAKSENNVRIDEQIAEMNSQLRTYAQNKADAQKILDELATMSRAKNEMLQDDINSHFNGVKFVLFDYLKNGEYKETCIPYVCDRKTGEWKRIGATANTALEIYGKVQIVNGLQDFYGQHLPIFIDFSAELDERTKNDIESGGQLIFLQVATGELKIEEIN